MIDMTNKGLDETVWLVGGMMRFGLLRHNNSSTQPSEHLAVVQNTTHCHGWMGFGVIHHSG